MKAGNKQIDGALQRRGHQGKEKPKTARQNLIFGRKIDPET